VLYHSTIQLLRFHFSFFLLPVYLFAISQQPSVNTFHALLIFCILHLLVYPSSNGYNSYMDKDDSPIGGLKNPLQPTKQLFYVSVVMDVLAVVLSLFISVVFSMGTLLYILASRAYSYRGIRLKKYPIGGFLTVFIFQGAVVFWLTYYGAQGDETPAVPLLPCVISSCLIGALYPLTQVYQHAEDKKDGVITLSYMLGNKGTFIFSLLLFITAAFLLAVWLNSNGQLYLFYLFLLLTLPVVAFFLYWMQKVYHNKEEANFKNSLKMNVIATLCTAVYFTTLIILK